MGDKIGKKNGAVKWQDFENEDYLKCLDPLLQQLNYDLPSARYERKTLARLFGELQQFMEDALGKQALPPKPFPKLPQKLLRDYSPDGPLNIIASICHRFRTENNWKRVEFINPARKRENVELLRVIRKELQRQRYLSTPVVWIHQACGSDVNRLRDAVQKLGGELANSPSDPRTSHMVYPFGPDGDPDDGLEYMRTLQFRGPQALVHFWYLPDSYDEYIPRHVAPDKLETDRKPIGPWKVYVRWVTDSLKFNEWMNPCDYETAEFQEEQEQKESKGKSGDGADRSRTQPAPSGVEDEEEDAERAMEEEVEGGAEGAANLKRKRVDEGGEGIEKEPTGEESPSKARRVEVDPAGSERIAPNAVRQKVLQPHVPAMEGDGRLENLSQGQRVAVTVPGVEKPVLPPRPQPPPAPLVKKELYTVPAHSAWFQWHKIHDIERRHVPDFFNGKSASKTPQLYVEYRNFMITKYREDPKRKLTFTECRKYLLGDVTGVMRVWQFLDSWGLINYMAQDSQKEVVDLETKGAPGAAVKVVTAPEAPSPNLLFNFSMPVVEPTTAATYGANNLSLVTRRDVFGQHRCAVESAPEKTEFFCNAMPHVNCTELRYHCTKFPDIDLCPQAYAEGRFPPGCTSKDFVRIDQRAQQADPSGWTQQETLLLLEALEMFGDNWSEVAEHVGSKSQVQCIQHFIQLPIEDQFLDELEEAGRNIGKPLPKTTGPAAVDEEDEEDDIPFADMGNPIMAQVAFLSLAVGPRVAAAAAKRALEVLSQEEPAVLKELEEARQAQMLAAPPAQETGRAAGARVGEHAEEVKGEALKGDHDKKAAEKEGDRDDKTGDAAPMETDGEADEKKSREVGAESSKEADETQKKGDPVAGAGAPTESEKEAEARGKRREEEGEGEGVALDAPISSTKVRVAAATALAAAAVKAKLMADNEEREIQRIVVQVVDQQMKKLDIKMKALNELEQALEQERAALANVRRQADVDRAELYNTMKPQIAPSLPQSQPTLQVNQAGMGPFGGPSIGPVGVTPAGGADGGPTGLISQQGQQGQIRPTFPSSFPGASSYLPQHQQVSVSSLTAAAQNLSTASRGLTMGPGSMANPPTPSSAALPPSSSGYNPTQAQNRQAAMLGIPSNTLGSNTAASLPFAASTAPSALNPMRPSTIPTSTSSLNSSQPPASRQPAQSPVSHNMPSLSVSTPPPQPTLPQSSVPDQGQYSHTQQASRLPQASNLNPSSLLNPGAALNPSPLQGTFPGAAGQGGVNLGGGGVSQSSLASALLPGMLAQGGALSQGLLGSRPGSIGQGAGPGGINMMAAGMPGGPGGLGFEQFLETLKMGKAHQQQRDSSQGPTPPPP